MGILLEDFEELKQRLVSVELLPKPLQDLFPFLRASEYRLIELMIQNNIWQTTPPPAPPVVVPPPGLSGSLQFALFPYWMNHPPPLIQNFLSGDDPLKKALNLLWGVISSRLPSQIDVTNYNALLACARGTGLLAPDGSIYGERQYEYIDLRWIWAWVDYLIAHHIRKPSAFGITPAKPIALSGAAPGQVKIALVGDWGTGDATASAVMARITGLHPDYIIHLGDVYYSGTGDSYWPLHEETNNLLGFWPQGFVGRSFTLNSNHEMYSGAEGYFQALRAQNSPFVAQNGTSYFALEYCGWTFLGFDTAYYSASPMFVEGSIGGPAGTQHQWVQGLNLSPDRVIALTHHTGLSDDGSAKDPLWAEINGALGGDPFAWYWGHSHLGVVYKAPAIANQPGSSTFSRCLGHGALPYGDASELHGAPRVEWYAHAPQPSGKQVYNGFVLLTLQSADGNLTSIAEEFYDLGSTAPTWSKKLYP